MKLYLLYHEQAAENQSKKPIAKQRERAHGMWHTAQGLGNNTVNGRFILVLYNLLP